MSADLVDAIRAAATEVVTGERNGLADWQGRSTTYEHLVRYLRELGAPVVRREILVVVDR